MAWSSDEYIGTDGTQITFGPGDIEQRRISINSSISAVLVNVTGINYTSELQITAYLSSSVTCTATDHNQNRTVHLQILGKSLSNSDV